MRNSPGSSSAWRNVFARVPARESSARLAADVLLPFERPRCLDCRYPLNVTVTAYSSRRGDYWYFKCPKCGQRYWSKDGRAHAVNPKGNWHAVKGRLRCDACGMECRIRSGHYWECPKCRKRFRNVKGRAVPTVPGYSAVRHLPFLRREEVSELRKFTSVDQGGSASSEGSPFLLSMQLLRQKL